MIGIKMNLKICKKCEYKTTLYLGCLVCFKFNNDMNEMVKTIIVSKLDKKLYKKVNEYLKKKEDKNSDVELEFVPISQLKNVEINKNCPYYIEHQMNDWNKKK